MKKIIIFFILLLSTFTINSLEKRTALIIGNSAYKQSALKNPENDAVAMTDTLKSLGFNVTIYKNVQTQNDMKRIVRDFGEKLRTNGGVGLFYYSGHGIQIKGINYLMPVNAVISSETDVEYEGLDFGLVLGKMEEAGNRLNICILDACRDNPFIKSFRSASEKGLAVISKSPPSTIIAYATGPGSVASDGTGKNGLYTEELLNAIKTPNLQIEDVFKKVGKNVSNRTNGTQLPWMNSSFYGEFSFISQNGQEKPDKPISVKEENLYGGIEIEVLENGKLYIDNVFICNVSAGKKITLKNISVGLHDIEIRYEDKIENKNIFIEKNKIIFLSFSYRKEEKPKEINLIKSLETGGTKRGWRLPSNSNDLGNWNHSENINVNGLVNLRVWGPTSGNSYGAEAWAQTKYNFNDGNQYVINFTWEASVNDNHYNYYYIQITDGYINYDGNVHWAQENSHNNTVNLLWHVSSGKDYPGISYPYGKSKSTWSIIIDPRSSKILLYDRQDGTGNLIREEVLISNSPWYIRFIISDATSSGFPAGDISFRLYSFSAKTIK